MAGFLRIRARGVAKTAFPAVAVILRVTERLEDFARRPTRRMSSRELRRSVSGPTLSSVPWQSRRQRIDPLITVSKALGFWRQLPRPYHLTGEGANERHCRRFLSIGVLLLKQSKVLHQ